MSLAEDLHRILSHFHLTHIPTLTNQGAAVAVEGHLAQLATVAGDVQRGDEAAMRVLGELYGASTVPAAPAAEAAPVVTAESVVSPTGLTAGAVVPAGAVFAAEPVSADIAAEAHAAVAEAEQPADEPAHDEPQGTEAAA